MISCAWPSKINHQKKAHIHDTSTRYKKLRIYFLFSDDYINHKKLDNVKHNLMCIVNIKKCFNHIRDYNVEGDILSAQSSQSTHKKNM